MKNLANDGQLQQIKYWRVKQKDIQGQINSLLRQYAGIEREIQLRVDNAYWVAEYTKEEVCAETQGMHLDDWEEKLE